MQSPPSAFRDSSGIVERLGRGKLRFSGDQARWFLDQLVSNRILDLEHEQVREALLLTPKGKITAVLRLARPADEVFADIDGESVSKLLEFFSSRVFATQVEIEDVTDGYTILSVLGPRAAETVNEALQRMYVPERGQCCLFSAGFLVAVERPIGGVDIWVRSPAAPQLVTSLTNAGATLLHESDLGALQVVEGFQVAGLDFDQTFLPQEAALERAVHFDKGCYLGQESVAMAQRGSVKRRLRHLHFDREPNDAAAFRVAEEDGRFFAIAAMKTSVAVGSETLLGDAVATVMELPGSVKGPAPPSARELRERLQDQG